MEGTPTTKPMESAKRDRSGPMGQVDIAIQSTKHVRMFDCGIILSKPGVGIKNVRCLSIMLSEVCTLGSHPG